MRYATSITTLIAYLCLFQTPTFGADIYKIEVECTCQNFIFWQKYTTTVTVSKTCGDISQPSPHKVMTAILVDEGTPPPKVEAVDTHGKPLMINGTPVQFTASGFSTSRVEEYHPSPAGSAWIGFESTELIPTNAGSEELVFDINYIVEGDTDEDSQKIIWVSNDSDIRHGDIVFGSGCVAEMVTIQPLGNGFDSGNTGAWSSTPP